MAPEPPHPWGRRERVLEASVRRGEWPRSAPSAGDSSVDRVQIVRFAKGAHRRRPKRRSWGSPGGAGAASNRGAPMCATCTPPAAPETRRNPCGRQQGLRTEPARAGGRGPTRRPAPPARWRSRPVGRDQRARGPPERSPRVPPQLPNPISPTLMPQRSGKRESRPRAEFVGGGWGRERISAPALHARTAVHEARRWSGLGVGRPGARSSQHTARGRGRR